MMMFANKYKENTCMHNINEYIPCYILKGKKESCARIERGKERKEEEDMQ